MSIFKKTTALFMAIIICCMAILSVTAANRKSSLSDYAGKGSLKLDEQRLYSFDDTTRITQTAEYYSMDTSDKKQGSASYSTRLVNTEKAHIFTITDFGQSINMKPSANRRVTLKMWINIENTEMIKCDHEDLYSYDYSNSATIYFRAVSGRNAENNHCINQTISGNGWQEVEFDLSHHNGISGNFDITDVTGCFLFAYVKGPVTVKVDDLRVCYYTNDGYTQDKSDIIDGARIVSTCDYDALDGVMVNEWFDSDFSEDIKHSGSSSVHSMSDASDDQRMYFSDNNIPLNKDEDYLCFWMYIDNIANLSGLFIEANQAQDTHEYELTNCVSQIPVFGKTTTYNNNWFMMQIPISAMTEHFSDDFPNSVTLKVLRISITAKRNTEVNVYIDSIFIATRQQVYAYNGVEYEGKEETLSTNMTLKSEVSSLAPEANDSNDLYLYIAIIGGAVLIVAIMLTVVIIINKKKAVKIEPKNKEV